MNNNNSNNNHIITSAVDYSNIIQQIQNLEHSLMQITQNAQHLQSLEASNNSTATSTSGGNESSELYNSNNNNNNTATAATFEEDAQQLQECESTTCYSSFYQQHEVVIPIDIQKSLSSLLVRLQDTIQNTTVPTNTAASRNNELTNTSQSSPLITSITSSSSSSSSSSASSNSSLNGTSTLTSSTIISYGRSSSYRKGEERNISEHYHYYNREDTDEDEVDEDLLYSSFSDNDDDDDDEELDTMSLSSTSSILTMSMICDWIKDYNDGQTNNNIQLDKLKEMFEQLQQHLSKDVRFQQQQQQYQSGEGTSDGDQSNRFLVSSVELERQLSNDFHTRHFTEYHHNNNTCRQLSNSDDLSSHHNDANKNESPTHSTNDEYEEEGFHLMKQCDIVYNGVKRALKKITEIVMEYLRSFMSSKLDQNQESTNITSSSSNNKASCSCSVSNAASSTCAEKTRSQEEVDSILEDALYEIDDYLMREDVDCGPLLWAGIGSLFSRNDNDLSSSRVTSTNRINSNQYGNSASSNSSSSGNNNNSSDSSSSIWSDLIGGISSASIGASGSSTKFFDTDHMSTGNWGASSSSGWYLFKDSRMLNSFHL